MFCGVDVVVSVMVWFVKLFNDFCDWIGLFDVIGDVYGCCSELEMLLMEFGYVVCWDDVGCVVGVVLLLGWIVVFVGDFVDCGLDILGVLWFVMGMVVVGEVFCVLGNYENKLVRVLCGKNVKVLYGLVELFV